MFECILNTENYSRGYFHPDANSDRHYLQCKYKIVYSSLLFQFWDQFVKEINIFIQQGPIQLIKSDSKEIYNLLSNIMLYFHFK